MSVQTLYTAATGMEALETKLDVIANNLANVSTVGFKKDRANFEDLLYRHEVIPGGEDTNETGVGIAVGVGTRVSSVQMNNVQGALQTTGRDLDVAIQGRGYFPVRNGAGDLFYTRAGNFSLNANGEMTVGTGSNGYLLDPPITLPQDAQQIRISADGNVDYVQAGNTDQLTNAGRIQLSTFINPEGLLKMGDNLYSVSDASGQAVTGNPADTGYGLLREKSLEMSNVEPVRELIDLIQTQRNFELNSQAVQAGDEVMQLISNLRR